MRRRHVRDRPKTTVTMRIPVDVLEDLAEMASVLGFGTPESLIRAYISEGMRKDESRLNQPEVRSLIDSLRRDGVAEEVIAGVLAETFQRSA